MMFASGQPLHQRQGPHDATAPTENHIVVTNVRLPYIDRERAAKLWTVECLGARVCKISPTSDHGLDSFPRTYETKGFEVPISTIDARGGLMLPSFCHSHIHLDKCFILDRCGNLIEGDFAEAMRVTKMAKAEFPHRADDLYVRGARIIRESVEYGVTSMRAHVEVDTSVGFACLEAAQKLQDDYRAQCDIQIAAFAQEPLFSSPGDAVAGPNLSLLKDATLRHSVTVVGSAPYVEPTIEQAKMNIGLIFDIADACDLNYVDFHLDYNLDPSSELLIYEVIAQLKRRYDRNRNSSQGPDSESSRKGLGKGPAVKCPRITIGHATRLQLLTPTQWQDLVEAISDFPITFVGLPQSDMFMQGRALKDEPLGAPRGTLRVPYIAKKYGVQIAMSVNNVDNAFTPQGSLDPLSLCTFGVAIFQTATPEDIRTLVRSVTLTSKIAISKAGQETPSGSDSDLTPDVGDPADFVILHGSETLQSAVLNPCHDRTTIKDGRVVSWRRSSTWLLS